MNSLVRPVPAHILHGFQQRPVPTIVIQPHPHDPRVLPRPYLRSALKTGMAEISATLTDDKGYPASLLGLPAATVQSIVQHSPPQGVTGQALAAYHQQGENSMDEAILSGIQYHDRELLHEGHFDVSGNINVDEGLLGSIGAGSSIPTPSSSFDLFEGDSQMEDYNVDSGLSPSNYGVGDGSNSSLPGVDTDSNGRYNMYKTFIFVTLEYLGIAKYVHS